MNRKKPYPIFREPTELTPDTPMMGIPGRIWDEALTGNFVANLQKGNEILRTLEARDQGHADGALGDPFDSDIFTLASKVFGTREAARIWMTKPAYGLEEEVPVKLCETPDGRKAVRAYLLKIEFTALR